MKDKLIALMEGLDIQNINDFIKQAKIGDYRNLGHRYKTAKLDTINKPTHLVNLRTKHDTIFNYDIYEITQIIEYNYDKSKTPIIGKHYRARTQENTRLGLLINHPPLLGYRFIVEGVMIRERDNWEKYLRSVSIDDLVEWDKEYYIDEMNKLNNKG